MSRDVMDVDQAVEGDADGGMGKPRLVHQTFPTTM